MISSDLRALIDISFICNLKFNFQGVGDKACSRIQSIFSTKEWYFDDYNDDYHDHHYYDYHYNDYHYDDYNYHYHDHNYIYKSVRRSKSMLESGWDVAGIAFNNDADAAPADEL